MFLEQYTGELIAFATGISGIVIGWLTKRKSEKASIKSMEVNIFEKMLQVINADVVDPLRKELAIVREEREEDRNEIKTLRDVLRKIHTCRNNANCPIVFELQKHENNKRKGTIRKPTTNRQREPGSGEDNEDDNNSTDNSETDIESGADR